MTSDRRLVAALAITQTIGYGVLYYAFAVFLGPMALALHASTTAVTGAATLAVVVSAAAAIPVGRWIDRYGGRGLMTLGSVLGTLAVLGWSRVHNLAGLYSAFAVIGLASAMVLYEPAFAVIVGRFDARRRPGALLAVTIVAGFASSIFLPLAGLLQAQLGWRGGVVVLAVILAAGTIPLHGFALRAGAVHAATANRAADRTIVVRRVLRDRGFWLLTIAFVAHSGAIAAVAVHLVGCLTALGHPPAFAAGVAGLVGVLSVTGRLVTTGLRRRRPTTTVSAALFGIQAAAAAALPFVGRSAAGAIVCVVAFGLGFGVGTIARPAVLAERYDTTGYATLAGTLALPVSLMKAGAPLAAAAISAAAGGYTPVMATVAAACLVAAGGLALTPGSAVPGLGGSNARGGW
jgi:predicted MFS family arabinose efflux permease